jgi:hypothetical protein
LGLTYGGTPATGSYIRNGNLVSFRIYVNLSTVSNFGTGSYSLSLPYTPIQDYVFRDGGIHQNGHDAHFQLYGDADSTSRNLFLLYHSGSKDVPMDGNSPLKLTTKDIMYISGTYEIQP